MANYLVTGAAGFIGAAVARRLVDEGNTVVTVDNLSTGFRENVPDNVEFIEGDCGDPDTYEELGSQKFDAIFHIAGQSSGEISFDDPIYDIRTNAESTILLLKHALAIGCKRFIYASTMSVYGENNQQEQFSESDITAPKSLYAVGKLASENYLRIYQEQYGIKYTSLRYFNVYGAGQNLANLKQGMVSIYLKQFIDDDFVKVEVKGSVERFRDLSYIDDVAEVTIESISNKKFYNDIVNIGTGKKTQIKTMLKLMKDYLHSDKEIIISEGTKGDQFGTYADISKLKSIYPKEFIGFDLGLKKMIRGIKDEM